MKEEQPTQAGVESPGFYNSFIEVGEALERAKNGQREILAEVTRVKTSVVAIWEEMQQLIKNMEEFNKSLETEEADNE